MSSPTYDDVLSELMAMIDGPVTISAQGAAEDDAAVLFMFAGTLTAGWDQELLEAQGAGDVAIFRVGAFSAFVERETFRDARISDKRVDVRLGNVWMEFARGLPPSAPP